MTTQALAQLVQLGAAGMGISGLEGIEQLAGLETLVRADNEPVPQVDLVMKRW